MPEQPNIPSNAKASAPIAACQPSSLAEWRDSAEDLIQNKDCVFLRNREITANYARAYLKHSRLFKWAGMAAFASHHVRLALKPYSLAAGKSACFDANSEGQSQRMASIRIIKDTNDSIYNDIYWAHMAYDGTKDGLKKIETAIGDNPEQQGLLEAFRKIDTAREMLEKQPESTIADELIWEANIDILRHEQVAMVQPRFERLPDSFSRVLSLFSTMHYQHGGRCKSTMLPGSFLAFVIQNYLGKKRLQGKPSVVNLEYRWAWILKGILPGFQCFEAENKKITTKLKTLVSEGGVKQEPTS